MAEKRNAVVRQAAFLMAAQMISSVVGLLYRSPLDGIIGDVGDGYYTYANDWYIIILLISSYSIPSAVSKVMAERLAVGQYKNAQKVFHAALIYALIVGTIGASVAWFGAPVLLRSMPNAIPALRVLAPTILFSGFLGVMRGYFQSHNTMKPTAFSQIAEQIMNAIVSVLAAYLLTRPFVGSGLKEEIGKHGAAGGTIGTGAGVVMGLSVMLLIYRANYKKLNKKLEQDRSDASESYWDVFKAIMLMGTPIILSTCVYNATAVVDQMVFTELMTAKGISASVISSEYGIFGYKFLTISNIPIALASATSTALIPAVATSLAAGSKKGAVQKIDDCVRMTLFIAIPSCFGLAILSFPIIRLLYPSGNVSGAAVLLVVGAITVVFYSLSTVMNGVLQGMGHPGIPVRNGLIALAVNIAVCAGFVWFLNLGAMSIVFSVIAYSFTIMVLDMFSIRKYLGYGLGGTKNIIPPLKASVVMGAVVAAVYWIPAKLLPDLYTRYLVSGITTVIAVMAGVLVYMVVYTKTTGMTDDELRTVPMGTRILQVLYKLHLRKR